MLRNVARIRRATNLAYEYVSEARRSLRDANLWLIEQLCSDRLRRVSPIDTPTLTAGESAARTHVEQVGFRGGGKMRTVIAVVVALALGAYFGNLYLEKKAKRDADEAENRRN